jgi:hypothetical protein
MKIKQPIDLIESPEKDKVSATANAISTSVKVVDAEQTGSARGKALRLFCRAMIRLYLIDQAISDDRKSLGILSKIDG